jgi:hypothetical protein
MVVIVESSKYWKKNLAQCHFVHHTSHVGCPWYGMGCPRCESDVCLMSYATRLQTDFTLPVTLNKVHAVVTLSECCGKLE